MESLAQELIDAIIDCLQHWDLRFSSLIARRWRRRSQQCAFAHVSFGRERRVVLWYTNIPQDPDGIPSYVQTTSFFKIEWQNPALFGLVVKSFSNLKSLSVTDTSIQEPRRPYRSVPFGEFSSQIAYLALHMVTCSTTTMISLIFSLPNLQDLSLMKMEIEEDEGAIPPDKLQSKVLQFLELQDVGASVVTVLTRYSLVFRELSMSGLSEIDMVRLLAPSSQILLFLELKDRFRDDRTARDRMIWMPQLPALETLVVEIVTDDISDRLADVLLSIHSAPQLSLITFAFSRAFYNRYFPVYDRWRNIDGWLARLARTRIKADDELEVEMWLVEAWPASEGFLRLFEEAGGEVRTRA